MRRALLLVLAGLACERATPALPRLGGLPAFSLHDQLQRPVTRDVLLDRVSVVSFLFTRCRGPCPLITARLQRLGVQLADEPAVRLISISVDPDFDTPAVLAAYAARFDAAPDRWRFLTGDVAEVERVVVDGFRTQMSRPDAVTGDVVHGNWLMLVDRRGELRGAFLVATEADVERLARLVRQLVAE
ncbi:MAG: SCO family protein [Myxococcaceae bacterium]|nr:SCO family protein [Myxococcaceae bacterium]